MLQRWRKPRPDAHSPFQPLPHPCSTKEANRTGETSQSPHHGLLRADLKLFLAPEWLPRLCSPTCLLNNIYCPPPVFQTDTQVQGVEVRKFPSNN